MGCDFVLIGVIGIYMEKEWRILLVRVERYFMYILNLVQLKIFVFLKIIFKNGIFGERFYDKISSYVVKIVFFWIFEEYNGDQWEDRNCLIYFWLCLRKLCYFVIEGFCLNYFI